MQPLDLQRLVRGVLPAVGEHDALRLRANGVQQFEELRGHHLGGLADAGPERADGRACPAGSGAEGIIRSALRAAERLRHPQSVDPPAGVGDRVVGLEIDVAADVAGRNVVALGDSRL
jgi:hypothetical protein